MKKGDRVGGRFVIERDLGKGAQGQTFLARDEERGELVALKRLHVAQLDGWKSIELFEREGDALAALAHPNIPRYVASFTEKIDGSGAFFLAQEYVAGQTLEELIARPGALDEPAILEMARAVLTTLAYLHGRRPPVIHRDIKPSNLIRREGGGWSLIDFGAVQATATGATALGTTVVGTAGYMPPEQAMGRAVEATDLYGLGATVVHALTGVHPNELGLERMKLRYRQRASSTPAPILDWLDRMVEPAVEDRFTSASSALDALDAATKSPAERAASPADMPERTKALLAAGVVVGLSLLVGLITYVQEKNDQRRQEHQNQVAERYLKQSIEESFERSVVPLDLDLPTSPALERDAGAPEPPDAGLASPRDVGAPLVFDGDPHRVPVPMTWTKHGLKAELVHESAELLGLRLVEVDRSGFALENGSSSIIDALTVSLILRDPSGDPVFVDSISVLESRDVPMRPGDVRYAPHFKGAKLTKVKGRVELVVQTPLVQTTPAADPLPTHPVLLDWSTGTPPRGGALEVVSRGVPSREDGACTYELVVTNTGDATFDVLDVFVPGAKRSIQVNARYEPDFALGQSRFLRAVLDCDAPRLIVQRFSLK